MQGWVHSYLQILTVQVVKEFSECIPFTSVTSNRFYGILNAKFNKKLKKKKKLEFVLKMSQLPVSTQV